MAQAEGAQRAFETVQVLLLSLLNAASPGHPMYYFLKLTDS